MFQGKGGVYPSGALWIKVSLIDKHSSLFSMVQSKGVVNDIKPEKIKRKE